jgi:hypothetical protein
VFGVRACRLQQPRVHQVVVQDDVGQGETLQSANRDEIRIPRSRANQIDDALSRNNLVGFGL